MGMETEMGIKSDDKKVKECLDKLAQGNLNIESMIYMLDNFVEQSLEMGISLASVMEDMKKYSKQFDVEEKWLESNCKKLIKLRLMNSLILIYGLPEYKDQIMNILINKSFKEAK